MKAKLGADHPDTLIAWQLGGGYRTGSRTWPCRFSRGGSGHRKTAVSGIRTRPHRQWTDRLPRTSRAVRPGRDLAAEIAGLIKERIGRRLGCLHGTIECTRLVFTRNAKWAEAEPMLHKYRLPRKTDAQAPGRPSTQSPCLPVPLASEEICRRRTVCCWRGTREYAAHGHDPPQVKDLRHRETLERIGATL